MDKNTENQINIELKEDVASGVYSNLAIITHSESEFVCDFIQMLPGLPKAQVKSRVIMSPVNAKRLMKALIENVQKYEQNIGYISDENTDNGQMLNFGNPKTQA